MQGDWGSAIGGRFACIVANPPYVAVTDLLPAEVAEHEPAAALFAGDAGLDAYRVLIPQLPALLAPGGVALVEIGATQGPAVAAMAAAAGLAATVRRDLGGRDRCIVAKA